VGTVLVIDSPPLSSGSTSFTSYDEARFGCPTSRQVWIGDVRKKHLVGQVRSTTTWPHTRSRWAANETAGIDDRGGVMWTVYAQTHRGRSQPNTRVVDGASAQMMWLLGWTGIGMGWDR
jgi:hypothetical protein